MFGVIDMGFWDSGETRLPLSEIERRVLLLSSPLARRAFGSLLRRDLEREGDIWIALLNFEELLLMGECINRDVCLLAAGKDRTILEGILSKVRDRVNDLPSLADSPSDRVRPWAPGDDFRQKVAQTVKDWENGRLPDLDKALKNLSRDHNESPIDEFYGLSPKQMHELLTLGWWNDERVINLNDDLPADMLENAPLLHNCRVLLEIVAGSGGVKATARGNLKRDTVQQVYDKAIFKGFDLYDVYWQPGVINEEDAPAVHMARIVCVVAGLLKKRKGLFEITKKGKSLLVEGNEGRLFAHLFGVYFRQFNLAYCDGLPELPGLQNTFPYTLYRLCEVAEGPLVGEKNIAVSLIHPNLLDEIAALEERYMTPERFLDIRILRHLEVFSLIAVSRGLTESGYGYRAQSFRKTELFDKFISFRF